jgi:hypothetical protein
MRLALAEAAVRDPAVGEAAGPQTRRAEDVPVGAVILDEAGTVRRASAQPPGGRP